MDYICAQEFIQILKGYETSLKMVGLVTYIIFSVISIILIILISIRPDTTYFNRSVNLLSCILAYSLMISKTPLWPFYLFTVFDNQIYAQKATILLLRIVAPSLFIFFTVQILFRFMRWVVKKCEIP